MTRLRSLALPVCCGAISLVLLGCSDNASSHSQGSAAHTRQKSADDIRDEESSRPPYVGMTKSEVARRYGRPKSVILTDMGERWTYFLNEGEVVGKALIPFYIPPRPRLGFLFFDVNGRVRSFRWDVVNEY